MSGSTHWLYSAEPDMLSEFTAARVSGSVSFLTMRKREPLYCSRGQVPPTGHCGSGCAQASARG